MDSNYAKITSNTLDLDGNGQSCSGMALFSQVFIA